MEYIELARPELPYEINEELKVLRANLQFCGDDKKVICITSCLASEGKSTISLNLACSLREQHKNVLLIDADLRKSVLRRKVTEGKVQYGLVHYLSGQCDLESILYRVKSNNLMMIFAGAVPPNPSELLGGKRMAELLKSARDTFDYVIVDTPPLGMVVDAVMVAQHCDGVAVVISANDVSYRAAQDVVHRLETAKCPVLGVILNKVDRRRSGKYYGKYYGRYYGEKYGEPY